jgi:hypothetical protein
MAARLKSAMSKKRRRPPAAGHTFNQITEKQHILFLARALHSSLGVRRIAAHQDG